MGRGYGVSWPHLQFLSSCISEVFKPFCRLLLLIALGNSSCFDEGGKERLRWVECFTGLRQGDFYFGYRGRSGYIYSCCLQRGAELGVFRCDDEHSLVG